MDIDFMNIVYASLSLGGLGLVFGIGLGIAANKFAIDGDPRIASVKAVLPGANCGGCGYPGCDSCAAAIVSGKADTAVCTVGGVRVAKQIGEILGIGGGKIEEKKKTVAYVKCSGSSLHRKNRYGFKGIETCVDAASMEITDARDCSFGCLGLGCCVRACRFGAISIMNGAAIVDEEKCTSCGACVKACPKSLIEIIPAEKNVRVACSSLEKGKVVRDACSAGCIGCGICVKACGYDAIFFENDLARVDYEKCVQCMDCTKKCPTKSIRRHFESEAVTTLGM